CGTFSPEGVNAIADLMQERFEPAGWKVERRRHTPGTGTVEEQLGDLLIARLEGSRARSEGGRRVLLVGHMDTVFPDGTAAERPIRGSGLSAAAPRSSRPPTPRSPCTSSRGGGPARR